MPSTCLQQGLKTALAALKTVTTLVSWTVTAASSVFYVCFFFRKNIVIPRCFNERHKTCYFTVGFKAFHYELYCCVILQPQTQKPRWPLPAEFKNSSVLQENSHFLENERLQKLMFSSILVKAIQKYLSDDAKMQRVSNMLATFDKRRHPQSPLVMENLQ